MGQRVLDVEETEPERKDEDGLDMTRAGTVSIRGEGY